jgi:hypothetical protein
LQQFLISTYVVVTRCNCPRAVYCCEAQPRATTTTAFTRSRRSTSRTRTTRPSQPTRRWPTNATVFSALTSLRTFRLEVRLHQRHSIDLHNTGGAATLCARLRLALHAHQPTCADQPLVTHTVESDACIDEARVPGRGGEHNIPVSPPLPHPRAPSSRLSKICAATLFCFSTLRAFPIARSCAPRKATAPAPLLASVHLALRAHLHHHSCAERPVRLRASADHQHSRNFP